MGLFTDTAQHTITLPVSYNDAYDAVEAIAKTKGQIISANPSVGIIQFKLKSLLYITKFTVNVVRSEGATTTLNISESCGSDGLLIRNGIGRAHEAFVSYLSDIL